MSTMNEEEIIHIDNLSVVPVFVEMYYNAKYLALGTAFFVEKDEKVYLISNWHNLSGRNSLSKKPLDKTLALPNKLRVYHHDLDNIGKVVPTEYNLYDEEGNALWLEHPKYANNIDVAALPIEKPNLNIIYSIDKAINDSDLYEQDNIEVGDNLFVLGYPFGAKASSYFPIWKAATIASEPYIDIDDLPKFYIDTATKQGMSGSVVIQKDHRAISIMGEGGYSNFKFNFLGIYSGRLQITLEDKQFDPQIGIVWKKKCVDEIIEGNKFYEECMI